MGNIKVDPFRWESVTCFPKPTRINQHFQNREPSEIGPDGDHARTEIDPSRIRILGDPFTVRPRPGRDRMRLSFLLLPYK